MNGILVNINFLNLTDASGVYFNPNKVLKKSISLDYNNLVEGKSNSLRSGEFAVHPIIITSFIHRKYTSIKKSCYVFYK